MISPNPASPNGTRARILILLTKNGPMTTAEIAEALGLTPKQVRDNSNQARHENLIASGRDDVTGTLAYSITPAGRDWVKALLSLGKPLAQDMTMLPKAGAGTSEETSAVAADEAPDEAPAIADAPAVEAPEPEAMFPKSISGTSEESSPVADDLAPDEAPAIADEAEEDRDLYVVFGASMPVPEIAGPTLENAQQQCISLAFDSGCDLTLYRLVPVGQTRTSVTFVSQ